MKNSGAAMKRCLWAITITSCPRRFAHRLFPWVNLVRILLLPEESNHAFCSLWPVRPYGRYAGA